MDQAIDVYSFYMSYGDGREAAVLRTFKATRDAIGEHVRAFGEKVQPQRMLRQGSQAVDVQPEVHRRAVQVHIQAFVELEHRSP